MYGESPVANVQRIAVLRANAIGDFVFTLPALVALRESYPGTEITLLALAWHAELLAGRPAPVDRVITLPPIAGVSAPTTHGDDPGHLAEFVRRVRDEQFDLALQLHGGGRYSNPLVRQFGARVTAGLRTPDAEPLDRWCAYNYYQHEVLRNLEAVALVGARTAHIEPALPASDAERTLSCAVVPDTGQPLVLLHPGAGDPRRRWPAEKFAAVAEALFHTGAKVIVNAVGDNRALADRILQCTNAPIQLLDGPVSLSAFAGLLARCRVVVANDSGPLHLASALGAATVGIYWCSNMVNAGPMTTHRHRACISWRLQCSECGADYSKTHCEHQHSLVAEVAEKEVIDAALTLFSQASDPAITGACGAVA